MSFINSNIAPTNAQLLVIARQAYAESLRALNIGKGDRRLDRQRVNDLWIQIQNLEQAIAAENGQTSDGGVAVAIFIPPQ